MEWRLCQVKEPCHNERSEVAGQFCKAFIFCTKQTFVALPTLRGRFAFTFVCKHFRYAKNLEEPAIFRFHILTLLHHFHCLNLFDIDLQFFFLQEIWFLLLTYWHVSGPWTTIYKGLLKFSSIWDARRKKQAHPWIKLCLAEEAAAHHPGVIRAPAAVMIPEIWREGFLLGICQPPTWKRKIWKTCSASMGK